MAELAPGETAREIRGSHRNGIWLRYFEELYHSIDLGIGATMTTRDDGTLLASYPVDTPPEAGPSHVASFASAPASPASGQPVARRNPTAPRFPFSAG